MQTFFTFSNKRGLPGPDRDPRFDSSISSHLRLVARNFARELCFLLEEVLRKVCYRCTKNKRISFLLFSFLFLLFSEKESLEICRVDLANFHPNKGDKRERSRVRDVRKISRKNKKRFFVLSSFPFWEFLKFVQNMRARAWLKLRIREANRV